MRADDAVIAGVGHRVQRPARPLELYELAESLVDLED